ncbi:DMT family transporter [Rubrobacter indicoceani]|uniref:DMT family transporter n=1 Tax=Rubrobacter indicoceani TaxID=2051957 RepID=UPI000E5A23FC|nr:multidrug efflux SMR transporter [Rubrobacter indicoceani]
MKVGILLILALAILSEVIGTTSLKASEGFTKWGPSVLVVVGYAASFYLLSLSLRSLPLGFAYAIWSGLGTVGAVLMGWLVWREALSVGGFIGIALIIAGVVVLNIFSEAH